MEEIEPNSFSLEYLEDKQQVSVKFEFTLSGEDNTQLELLGQLHRSDQGEVGIEWTKTSGHDYWLTAIQNSLNESLQTLAWSFDMLFTFLILSLQLSMLVI